MHFLDQLIGESASMKQVKQLIKRISQNPDIAVLICGETGTGKGIVARAIHSETPHLNGPFLGINCAAIPEHLLESELFGYEKGAYTGAEQTKRGLFEIADEGTLFLDEIGSMGLGRQAKLLKAVEEKAFRRLGGERQIHAKVRIIASTNKDMQGAVRSGEFREDLYYRLNEIQLTLPPLRERGDDIITLAQYFIREFDRQYTLGRRVLDDAAKECLKQHTWPGNIRELRNVILRAMILHDSPVLKPDMIPISNRSVASLAACCGWDKKGRLTIDASEGRFSLAEVERHIISYTLNKTGGNKKQAARLLKISYPRLMRKMEQHGIDPHKNRKVPI